MKDSAKIDSVTNNNENGTYTIVYKANDNEGNIYTFIANENGKIELSNGIIISPSNLELELVRNGETVTKTPKTIRASLTNVDGQVTWSVTSGAGVVSLSNTTGTAIEVTPEAGGQATITASVKNGTYTDTCTVTVEEKIGITSIGDLTGTTTVNKNLTTTLTAPVEPNNATETLNWESSDTLVAGVTPSQDTRSVTVSGVAGGTATITASNQDGKISKSVKVTVNVPVTEINITPTTAITIAPDGTATLTATVEPSDATNKNVTWSITPNDLSKASIVGAGNTEVASIAGTSGGSITVKGKADGQATVTVTSDDNSEITASKTITVGEVLGHFKTLKDNVANKWKAYYFPGETDDNPIEITNNPSDAGYLGNFLGMKVNYTPSGHLTNTNNVEIGKGGISSTTYDTYRVFYIDVNGDYGDEKGTIYLKADYDGVNSSLDYLPTGSGTTVTNAFNKKWAANTTYTANPKTNMTYVNKLLDKSIWTNYQDTTGIANYAVGAPSLEMWIDSYNAFLKANQPTSGTFYEYNCTVTQNTDASNTYTVGTGTNAVTRDIGPKGANNGYGYYVGTNVNANSGIIEAYYNESGSNGYNTATYSLVKASNYTSNVTKDRLKAWNPETGYYWLASPSAYYSNSVMRVSGKFSLVNDSNYIDNYAFCPLVSCNSRVNINQKK